MSQGNVIYLTDDPAARSRQGYEVVRADKVAEAAASNSSLSWFVDTKPVYKKMISSIVDSNADLIADLKDIVLIIEAKFRRDPNDRTPESLFRSVIEIDPKTDLAFEEFLEIRKEAHPEDFIIGGRVNFESKTITLYRGDFSTLLVSFGRFKKNALSEPDFAKFKVVDHGMGIRLGDYEASIYPILYELDSSYRIRVNKQRKNEDKSFGACLYRARRILEINQNDFPGLSRETILRIENEKTKKLRRSTKERILKRLGISEHDLLKY